MRSGRQVKNVIKDSLEDDDEDGNQWKIDEAMDSGSEESNIGAFKKRGGRSRSRSNQNNLPASFGQRNAKKRKHEEIS